MDVRMLKLGHVTSSLGKPVHLWTAPLGVCSARAMQHNRQQQLSSTSTVWISNQVEGDKPAEIPQAVQLRRSTFLKIALAVGYSTYFEVQQNSILALPDDCPPVDHCDSSITQEVFLDVAIDKEPVGQIVIGLFGNDVPIGAKRFSELAAGKGGLGYRQKAFNRITDSYVQNAGLRSFSLTGGVSDLVSVTGGCSADALVAEMEQLEKKGLRKKNVRATVSLVVTDPSRPPPKTKLVARDGKIDFVEEESRPGPNGTEFAIVTADAPELDSTNLVVGKVLKGMDVVEKISHVRVVKDNSSSPYFQVAKLIGDSRATVAEKGFNRPYSRITVTKSGLVT